MSRVPPRAIASAIVTALLVAVFLPTTAAGVASAHAGGLSSSASLPRVLAVEPAAPGVTVTVVESGARGGAPGRLHGSSTGLLMCCVAGALLGLIVTPVDVLSFHDAVVPFAWGADLDRLLIAITLGGGLGVAAAAVGPLRRTAPA